MKYSKFKTKKTDPKSRKSRIECSKMWKMVRITLPKILKKLTLQQNDTCRKAKNQIKRILFLFLI